MRLHATRRAAIAQARGLGNPLWDLAGAVPSLDLRFAESKSLIDAVSGQQLITFSRQSDRSIITSAGGMDVIGTGAAGFTHDPFTLESLGLFLEEPRWNLMLNSAAPANQNITIAATPYTLSFYGSGDIVLTGAHSATVIGTGAFPNRQVLTFTPTAGTLGVTVSGTVEFTNLEPGTSATSWIPTGVSQATRSADVVSIVGANFSSWFNANETTLRVEGQLVGGAADTYPFVTGITSATQNNDAIGIAWTSNNSVFRASIASGGSNFADIPAGLNKSSGSKYVAALSLSSANAQFASDGALGGEDTSVTIPAVDRLLIGQPMRFQPQANTTIRRLTYWPQRLPNSTLQSITL